MMRKLPVKYYPFPPCQPKSQVQPSVLPFYMFAARRGVRAALVSRTDAGFWHVQRRGVASKELRRTPNDVAKQLSDTGLWRYERWIPEEEREKEGVKPKKKRAKGDKARVNITSNELCGDIIDYIRPTLERHKGCDILDLFPGPGVWSRKLHDAVQPRSHLLLEPDHELYGPMLEDLIERPNVQLLPNNGYQWPELNEVLTPKYLPHQVEQSPEQDPKRNDTLLVTANFSFHPKKKFGSFDNLTQLLLFQFVNSIRQRSLIYKYGLVRMLVWVGDDEKNSVLPRLLQRRKRVAVDAELSTEYIAEVAGANGLSGTADSEAALGVYARDHVIDLESSKLARERMERSGIKIPPGREASFTRAFDALPEEEKRNLHAGNQPAVFHRDYQKDLAELEALVKAGKVTMNDNKRLYTRYKSLTYKNNWEVTRAQQVWELMRERESLPTDLTRIPDDEHKEATAARVAAWEDKIARMDRQLRKEFLLSRDNLHVFHQDPPVLSWDRRPYEPLSVSSLEFFPNIPCALLDIQPKAMNPLFREWGRDTDRSGKTFGVLLPTMFRASLDPLDKVLEGVYPGAAEGVLPHCPSLINRDAGGIGYSGAGGLSLRALNERQLVEILDAWMKWPFRPSFSELVGRGSPVDDDYLADVAEESFTKSQTTD